MNKQLNVLLIEDSEQDASLIIRELEHGGYQVTWERAYQMDDVKNALTSRPWDVIISDHAMPGTCALDALSMAKKIGVSAPFIIVSGWMTDELAQTAMKEGARGFVPKNRLSRLVPLVEKELVSEASGKKAAKKPKVRK